MTREQLTKLLDVVDAKIATKEAKDTSDGGLAESVRETELVNELYKLFGVFL